MSFFVGVDVSKEKFAIADIFMNGLRGNRPRATVTMLVETAVIIGRCKKSCTRD